jgi:hypothetical protein
MEAARQFYIALGMEADDFERRPGRCMQQVLHDSAPEIFHSISPTLTSNDFPLSLLVMGLISFYNKQMASHTPLLDEARLLVAANDPEAVLIVNRLVLAALMQTSNRDANVATVLSLPEDTQFTLMQEVDEVSNREIGSLHSDLQTHSLLNLIVGASMHRLQVMSSLVPVVSAEELQQRQEAEENELLASKRDLKLRLESQQITIVSRIGIGAGTS